MKTFIAAVALFASAALAQDLSALPECGQNCITSMLGLAGTLGCSATDVACLCSNMDFGYGVRDCSAQSCPAGTDLSGVTQYAVQYCGAPEASSGTFPNPGAATSAVTASPTVTDPAALSSETSSTNATATDSAAGAITTSEVVSTITTDGSTITSTVGSTTIFSSGVSESLSAATESASSALSSASESLSSALSSASGSLSSRVASATSAVDSATSAAGAAATSSGAAYPMATVAVNGMAGIAGLAALLVL